MLNKCKHEIMNTFIVNQYFLVILWGVNKFIIIVQSAAFSLPLYNSIRFFKLKYFSG